MPGDADRPHGLTRSGSVNGATPETSETRFTCLKADGDAAAGVAPTTSPVTAASETSSGARHRAIRRLRDPLPHAERVRWDIPRFMDPSVPSASRPPVWRRKRAHSELHVRSRQPVHHNAGRTGSLPAPCACTRWIALAVQLLGSRQLCATALLIRTLSTSR